MGFLLNFGRTSGLDILLLALCSSHFRSSSTFEAQSRRYGGLAGKYVGVGCEVSGEYTALGERRRIIGLSSVYFAGCAREAANG